MEDAREIKGGRAACGERMREVCAFFSRGWGGEGKGERERERERVTV